MDEVKAVFWLVKSLTPHPEARAQRASKDGPRATAAQAAHGSRRALCALLTMRSVILLNLVLRRREAPSRRTGHGRQRCPPPMVRDAHGSSGGLLRSRDRRRALDEVAARIIAPRM